MATNIFDECIKLERLEIIPGSSNSVKELLDAYKKPLIYLDNGHWAIEIRQPRKGNNWRRSIAVEPIPIEYGSQGKSGPVKEEKNNGNKWKFKGDYNDIIS